MRVVHSNLHCSCVQHLRWFRPSCLIVSPADRVGLHPTTPTVLCLWPLQPRDCMSRDLLGLRTDSNLAEH